MNEKKIEKLGCVIPYQVWDALKNHNPATIAEVIGLMVAYDRDWRDYQKNGLDGLGKMTPSAAMAFSFAKPLIDANNQKYFARIYKGDETAVSIPSAANTGVSKTRSYYQKKGGKAKNRV